MVHVDAIDFNSMATIGMDFKMKTVYHESSLIRLQGWDQPGGPGDYF
jgi:hypothetical protein